MARVAVLVLASLSLLGAAASVAQSHRVPQEPATPWLAVRVGIASYGTGDDVNCATLPAWTGGVRVGTPTRWFAAMGADLYDGLSGFDCTAVLPIIDYGGGVYGEEFAAVWLSGAPRLTASVGYRRALLGVDGEVSAVVGALRSSSDGGPGVGRETGWRSYQGGALLVGPAGAWWAVSAERGRHRVPVRHEMYRVEGHSPRYIGTRRLERWAPLTRIGVELRW